jgi:carboxypeptidase Q
MDMSVFSSRRPTLWSLLIWLLAATPAVWAQPAVERIASSAASERGSAEGGEAAAVADAGKAVVEPQRDRPNEIERIIAAGRENNQVMAHLDHLVNRIGPRLTSSDNLTNACDWTRDRFASLGLANAHLEKWGEWPVGFNRGPWTGQMVTPELRMLEFATDSWTAGTKGKQRGPAVIAPTNSDELAMNRDKLKGAWLLAGASRGRGGGRGQGGARRGDTASSAPEGEPAAQVTEAPQPPADGQPPAERGARRGRRGGRGNRGGGGRGFNDPFRAELETAAREMGALGMIARRNAELIVTGGRRPETAAFFDNLPTLPQIAMTASSYDAIANHVRDGEETILEFDIRNYFKKGPIPLFNVVADIPGSEFPDEYVIVCGHLDSWDAGTGTTDNGTGCATAIEAARILMAAGVRPKRTIRFILWTGEEQGLLGSRAYIEAHPELTPKTSAVMNHDVGTQYISSIKTLPFLRSDLERVFAPVMSLNSEFPFRLQPADTLLDNGSDNASFSRVNVPAFLWGQSGDLARYNDTHHTQLDTFERAVPSYQEHSSIVVALAAYGFANLDHMLPRERADEPQQ